MRNSLNNIGACVALTLLVWNALAAQDRDASDDLVLDADSLAFNRQTNLFEARRPRIVQGNVRIEADESAATGVDWEQSSVWQFKGHVRITVDNAVLAANSATFKFDRKELSTGELEGSPASFEDTEPQQQPQQQRGRGGAERIVYDRAARTLRLFGDGKIDKGQIQVEGCDLIYDFNDGAIKSGSTECGKPFRIRVPAKTEKQASPAAPPQ